MHDLLGHLCPVPILLEHGYVRAAVAHRILREAHASHELPRINYETKKFDIYEVRKCMVFVE